MRCLRSCCGYFYSHAPRGARPVSCSPYKSARRISTHTPLAGRDCSGNAIIAVSLIGKSIKRSARRNFYSHAPRGARPAAAIRPAKDLLFLLTRPSRGATAQRCADAVLHDDFYSHAPRGARLLHLDSLQASAKFLLTRPSRGATAFVWP